MFAAGSQVHRYVLFKHSTVVCDLFSQHVRVLLFRVIHHSLEYLDLYLFAIIRLWFLIRGLNILECPKQWSEGVVIGLGRGLRRLHSRCHN